MKKLKLPGLKQTGAKPEAMADVKPAVIAAAPAEAKPEAKGKKTKVKRPKAPRPKHGPIISPWAIFLATLRLYRENWKGYAKIMAVVAIPTNIIGLFNLGTADAVAQSYISFASIVMNVSFIWAISRQQRTGKLPNVPTAYYDGSIALVRFILISFAILVMLIPGAFGVSLYAVARNASDYYANAGPELFLAALVMVVLSIPTLYLMVRYALAPFALVLDDLRPIAALRRSRLVTLGRFWQVGLRQLALALFILISAVPAVIVLLAFSIFKIGNVPVVMFQIVATLTILPIIDIYMLRLYSALEESFEPVVVEQIEGITQLEKEQLKEAKA